MANVKLFNFRGTATEIESSDARSDKSHLLRLLKTFEESDGGWFWATNAQGMLTYLSQSVADLYGKKLSSLLGTSFVDLFSSPDANTPARERLPIVFSRQTNFDKLTLQTAKHENPRWWDVSGRVHLTAGGGFDGYSGFAVDITERLASSKSASKLAMFDPLTDLPNRLNMSSYLEEHLGSGRPCAVLMLDLDRFKAINDTLGHAAGDALLKQVAKRLFNVIKEKEKIFRLGGDEFQIVLPGRKDPEDLCQIADDIISSLSQPYSIDGTRCVIGASIGVAICPQDGREQVDLMRKADLALYAAKSSGRGCSRFYSNNLLKLADDRRLLEEDLRDALAKNELSLYYQPQVSTDTETVTGVEALIRWNHPKRGPISPALFIPIAEEANLIDNLGAWIIRKACEDAALWPGNMRVAVNISPIQFANPALPAIVTSALASSELLPGRLELELTEGVFLAEGDETDEMFAKLKTLGVRLALDDFGTGYSSLSYLKTAPFDKIKIDQSFVRDATQPGSRNRAIIAAIVALAGALEMETTAEGIETLDQLELMRKLGVSHIQGYVYSKAISNETLHEKLEDGKWGISPSGPARHRSHRRSMFRKAAAILDGHYHPVLVRNLSETGALIEGLSEMAIGTPIILDLGDGQLETATVRRKLGNAHGIEFGKMLVSDGEGSFETSRRITAYMLAKNGLSGAAQSGQSKVWDPSGQITVETLADILGLMLPPDSPSASFEQMDMRVSPGSEPALTRDISEKFRAIFSAANPLQNLLLRNSGSNSQVQLKEEEWERLKQAVEESHNPQLKNIIALVVLTGARFQELLTATWDDIDLERRVWTVRAIPPNDAHLVHFPLTALDIFDALPRTPNSNFIIINPRTKKPYNSVFGSWDAARKKVGLDNVSIHDLRKSIKKTW